MDAGTRPTYRGSVAPVHKAEVERLTLVFSPAGAQSQRRLDPKELGDLGSDTRRQVNRT